MPRNVLSEAMDSVLRDGGPGVMNGTLSDASSETMADVLVRIGTGSEALDGVRRHICSVAGDGFLRSVSPEAMHGVFSGVSSEAVDGPLSCTISEAVGNRRREL